MTNMGPTQSVHRQWPERYNEIEEDMGFTKFKRRTLNNAMPKSNKGGGEHKKLHVLFSKFISLEKKNEY